MAKRKKIVTAGRWVRAAAYTAPNSTGNETARRARLRLSSAARQRMNLRTSAQKLQEVLNCNFGPRDLHVTLNYDDAHRPEEKAEGVKLVRRYLCKLRAYRRARGQPLRYVYTTEKYSSKSRHVHHHLVVNAVGDDFAVLRELWTCGTDVEIQYLRAWGLGLEALAQYLTKEPRTCGKTEVGARTWTPSLGLKRPPPPETGFMKESETLEEPFGAIILKREEKKNAFGSFLYLEYWMPERTEELEAWTPPQIE